MIMMMIRSFLNFMGTVNNNERIERDERRIRVLERMNESESRTNILKKILSVIQEYMHDIALWRF